MKITIEREGKETKIFETNGIIFVANLDEHVQSASLFEDLSVTDIADLIYSLQLILFREMENFPEASKLVDLKTVLKGLSESFEDDLDDNEEAENDA